MERRSKSVQHVERIRDRPGWTARCIPDAVCRSAGAARSNRCRPQDADQYKIMGTRQRRLDIVPKTNGTAMYGMDVRVPA